MPHFKWDEQKRKMNMLKHGVDFVAARYLWDSQMLFVVDSRKNYGEQRWIGTGLLGNRVMVAVFTQTATDTIRIISFRKANRREVRDYEKEITEQKTKICNLHSRRIKTFKRQN